MLENAVQDLEAIAGQKVVVTRARKAVSTFKIREEYPIGCKVTLRGEKCMTFLRDWLIWQFRGKRILELKCEVF